MRHIRRERPLHRKTGRTENDNENETGVQKPLLEGQKRWKGERRKIVKAAVESIDMGAT